MIVRHQRIAMTKQEFISKCKAYHRVSPKGAVIFVLGLLVFTAFLMGGIELMLDVRAHIRNQWLAPFAVAGVWGVVCIPMFIIFRLFIRGIQHKLLRLGLVCPGCGSAFLGQSARAVVKTGSCARCGKKILDEKADA